MLSLATLTEEFTAYADSVSVDSSIASRAREFAERYGVYAREAQGCGGVINTARLPAAYDRMTAVLTPSWASFVDPTTAAAVIATSVQSFWLGLDLWTPIPPAGPASAVAVAGLSDFVNGLGSYWTTTAATGTDRTVHAVVFSLFLHALTRTVTVTFPIPGPSTCTGPIT